MFESDCSKKGIILFIAICGLWNVVKLPYYMSFYNPINEAYREHGIELSINLGYWVSGYRSLKMRCPPHNFLLVHASTGITLLAMMILTIIKAERRKKYCMPFFIFAIFEGLHTFPAAVINDGGFAPLFTVACSLLIGSGIWGIQTKTNYDKDPATSEKNLLIQYIIVTIVNIGAAFLEAPNIMKAFSGKDSETGEFVVVSETPHKMWGNTFYDKFPEKLGMTYFVLLTTVGWVLWPLYLTQFSNGKKKTA